MDSHLVPYEKILTFFFIISARKFCKDRQKTFVFGLLLFFIFLGGAGLIMKTFKCRILAYNDSLGSFLSS